MARAVALYINADMARAVVPYIKCGYGAGSRAVYKMRIWRNWQTRRFQVPVGDRAGSTPVIRTNS